MKKALGIAASIWIQTALLFSAFILVGQICKQDSHGFQLFFFSMLITIVATAPTIVVMLIACILINRLHLHWKSRTALFLLLLFFISVLYSIPGYEIRLLELLFNIKTVKEESLLAWFILFAIIFLSALIAAIRQLGSIAAYFSENRINSESSLHILHLIFSETINNNHTMETSNEGTAPAPQSNRIMIKGLITGALILVMMIPTFFVQQLVTEREQRQKEVVKEVSSKWAAPQVVSGPYLVVNYRDSFVNNESRVVPMKKQLILLPEQLEVNGELFPEERPRSIYKVLLYKTSLALKGTFKPSWTADVQQEQIDFTSARLCFNLSDFKGIEESFSINLGSQNYQLKPGLPLDDFGTVGLSVPVSLNLQSLDQGISFDMKLKVKGSEQLQFLPLAANSRFNIRSTWNDPSFDGNSLPNVRKVNSDGFMATWHFNQANLPYSTVQFQGTLHQAKPLAFGVSLVQPAGQYDKTMRSVKYAILFIGLTFALFFIIELMQRRPFHPVQYILVGLALVIFYTLLLSISEYVYFDYAYLIASLATILLISFYAKSHFASWKTAAVFATILGMLYSFIFILIRLEDTALLIGSIGLFLVLAIVMFASRKVNWYGSLESRPALKLSSEANSI
jgi:inner membrane protein